MASSPVVTTAEPGTSVIDIVIVGPGPLTIMTILAVGAVLAAIILLTRRRGPPPTP